MNTLISRLVWHDMPALDTAVQRQKGRSLSAMRREVAVVCPVFFGDEEFMRQVVTQHLDAAGPASQLHLDYALDLCAFYSYPTIVADLLQKGAGPDSYTTAFGTTLQIGTDEGNRKSRCAHNGSTWQHSDPMTEMYMW